MDMQTMDTPASVAQGFRAAMRRLAAGVAVITTAEGGRPYGMTATAVTSLCAEPPSLLVCVNRGATLHDPVAARGAFCVNLLRRGHDEVCRVCSSKPDGEVRFATGVWDHGEGLPRLEDAQASLFCRVAGSLAHGTHTVFIGEVFAVRVAEEVAPLVYLDGGFRG